MASLVYLNADDVVRLHAKAIAHSGGEPTLLDRGKLESAVAQPPAAFGGVEVHPDLASKAAAYLFYLAKAHAFADGNKRASVLAAVAFLDVNGHDLDAGTDEFEKLVIDLVTNEIERSQVTEFIRARMVPQDRPSTE